MTHFILLENFLHGFRVRPVEFLVKNLFKFCASIILIFELCILYSCTDKNTDPINDNDIFSVEKTLLELSSTDLSAHSISCFINEIGVLPTNSLEYDIRYEETANEWLNVYINYEEAAIIIKSISYTENAKRKAYIDLFYNQNKTTITVTQEVLQDSDELSSILGSDFVNYLNLKGYGSNGEISFKQIKDITDLGNLQNSSEGFGMLTVKDFSIFSLFKNLRILGNPLRNDGFLYIAGDSIVNIDFSIIPNIECINISGAGSLLNIKNIDISNKIKVLQLYQIGNDSLDLSSLAKLEWAELCDGECSHIDINNCISLRHLGISYLHISDLDISKTNFTIENLDNGSQYLEISNFDPDIINFNLYIDDKQIPTNYLSWRNFIFGYKNIMIKLHNEMPPTFHIDIDYGAEYIDADLIVDDPGYPKIKYSGGLSSTISTEHITDDAQYSAYNLWSNESTPRFRHAHLTPGETYYLKIRVETEAGSYYYSDEHEITTRQYVEPKAHINSIDATHNSATINFILDKPGYYKYSGYIIAIDNTPDFTLENAKHIYAPNGWNTSEGCEQKGTLTGLCSETTYYAKVYLRWSTYYQNNLFIATDPVEFNTKPEPEPSFNVYMNYLKVSRQRHNHIGNGMMHFESILEAKASYNPTDKEVSVYFETDIWGNYGANITSPGNFSTKEYIDWYWDYTPPKPEMRMRAVVIYNGKKYYSEWKSYSM